MVRYQQVPEHCRPCLERLAKQAMELACGDGPEKIEKALAWLSELYHPEIPPPIIASKLHRRIKAFCENEDPYRPLKEREIEIARRMAQHLRSRYGSSFEELLLFSLLGNAIDFFRSPEEIEKALEQGVKLAIDHRPKIASLLAQAKQLLFLTDNAGEVFFDLPLLKWLAQKGPQTFYVVKPSPIQNDLSLADLTHLQLSLPVPVVNPGTEMVGLDLREAAPEFQALFWQSDLILAKGMGHFETLSEESHPGLCFILCAKCYPVSRALQVDLNSYVILKT